MTRPVAWLAYAPDASESSFVTLSRQQAEAAARDWGWTCEPLFAGLTDAEREAVRRAVRDMSALPIKAGGDKWAAATLLGLLERINDIP